MPCKYYDSGWCYAPDDVETTAEASQCNRMNECPQSVKWADLNVPPINQKVLPAALDFYADESDDWNVEDNNS